MAGAGLNAPNMGDLFQIILKDYIRDRHPRAQYENTTAITKSLRNMP